MEPGRSGSEMGVVVVGVTRAGGQGPLERRPLRAVEKQVGGETRWAEKRSSSAEELGWAVRGPEEAGRGWPPALPRPGAASPRVPLAVAVAKAVAAVAAGRA